MNRAALACWILILAALTGYTQRQREEARDYEPPWVRQHDREGWIR